MATGFDDFGTSGNWTADRDATASTWTHSSGQLVVTTNSIEGLSLNAIDSDADRDNIQLLFKVEALVSLATTSQYVGFCRGTTGGSGPNRYAVRMGGGNFRIYKYVNSATSTQVATVTTSNFNAAGVYWVRFDVQSTTCRARIWKDGTSEPTTWSENNTDNAAISATDSSITGDGWAGVQASSVSTGSIKWLNGLGYGTNGDTAPSSAGGTTHDVSTAETGSATDTPTAVATFAASAAETASAADTPSAIVTAAGTVAETASATDTPTAAQTTTGAIAEAGSAAETTDASVTSAGVGAIAETASAADTPTAVFTTTGSLAEGTASAADVATAAAIWAAVLAETASSSDTTDAVVVPAGASAIVEAGSAVDTCSAVIITAGSIAEGTASATDTAAAAAIWATATIAESASAADTVAATLGIVPVYDSPAPTRTLTDSTTRIGSSPVSADTRRIGASPTGHTPRRLG
jgi:ketosteroid isomerase-like protein